MTSETWHKRLDPHLHEWGIWADGADYVRDLPLAVALNETIADRIIADHNLAQWAREHGQPALERLEAHDTTTAPSPWRIARKALAAYPGAAEGE